MFNFFKNSDKDLIKSLKNDLLQHQHFTNSMFRSLTDLLINANEREQKLYEILTSHAKDIEDLKFLVYNTSFVEKSKNEPQIQLCNSDVSRPDENASGSDGVSR